MLGSTQQPRVRRAYCRAPIQGAIQGSRQSSSGSSSTQRRVQFTRIDITAAQAALEESAIQRHHLFKQPAPPGCPWLALALANEGAGISVSFAGCAVHHRRRGDEGGGLGQGVPHHNQARYCRARTVPPAPTV